MGRLKIGIARPRTSLALLLVLTFATAVFGDACASGTTLPPIPTIPGPHDNPMSAINGLSVSQLPQQLLGGQLAAIRANGIQMVRSDAPWGIIEPQAPSASGPAFHFGSTDAWVSALAENHLTWEPILGYKSSWGNPIVNYPAFQAYVQAVAARYGAGGTFWRQNPQLPNLPVGIFELWNEENNVNSSLTYIPASDYAALYQAVHAAIHAVDSAAVVIIGGMGNHLQYLPSHDDAAWYLLHMLVSRPSLIGHIDGIGLHPYGNTANDTIEWVAHFRYALSVWGLSSVPIYVTEFGWTSGSADADRWRAAQMGSVALTLTRSNCGIHMLAPYDWSNPLITHETADFGLVDQSGIDSVLRPAGAAWFDGLRAAQQMATIDLCPPTRQSISLTGAAKPAASLKRDRRPELVRRLLRRAT